MNTDLQAIYAAASYSAEKHARQERSSNPPRPYFTHTFAVAATVARHGFGVRAQIAAMLHDVVEDQFPATGDGIQAGLDEIQGMFGADVAEIVGHLTLPYDCRSDKAKKAAYQKRMMWELNLDGCAIKVADKMSNVGDMIGNPPARWSTEQKLAYCEEARSVVDEVNGFQNYDTDAMTNFRALVDEFYATYERTVEALRALPPPKPYVPHICPLCGNPGDRNLGGMCTNPRCEGCFRA